jgi:hypothetical protein
MKKVVIKSLILAALVFALTGAIIMVPLPPNAYELAIIDKHKTLEETPCSRLIIAGGSNCAFGIDSAEMESALNMPVINMGLDAGFGLGRILDDITPYTHSGDILLIIPEYEYFTYIWNGGTAAWMLIFDTGFIKSGQYHLLFSRYYGFPPNFGSYLQEAKINSIPRLFEPVDPTPRVYYRNGFDKYGDEVAHLSLPPSTSVRTAPPLGSINQLYLNDFSQLVDEFVKKGVTVLLSYPSYDAASFDNSKDTIAHLDRIFRKAKNMTVISTPSEYRTPREDMYDTTYHLNARGRQTRTARLVADLEAWKAARSKSQTD